MLHKSSRFQVLHLCCLTALLVLGAAARLYGAWCYSLTTDPDCGIVALMARHMALGASVPVFFYGQAYMGSLEPFLSSVFCRILGINGFAVCLGTALPAFLLLPVVYLWGVDAGGRKAGYVSLVFCLVGPCGFFPYMSVPRGGYAVVVLCSAMVLWLSARVLCMELQGRKAGLSLYLTIGLLAGVGWWTSQLVVAALATVALLFVFLLRRRAVSLRSMVGVGGFFLGGAPFWAWNALNNWETFRFFGAVGKTDCVSAMGAFFSDRLPLLMGVDELPFSGTVNGVIVGGVLLLSCAFVVVAVGYLLFAILRGRRVNLPGHAENVAGVIGNRPGLAQVLVALCFLTISVLVYCTSSFSRFHTARYLVPLVPAFAVILGFVAARAGLAITALPIVLLLATQPQCLFSARYRAQRWCAQYANAFALADYLRKQGEDVVYVPYAYHWLNFALDEEFCFCGLTLERYRPYAVTAELSDRVAVLGTYANTVDFMECSGGTGVQAAVVHDFVAPTRGWSNIPPESWTASVTTEDGLSLDVSGISDANRDSGFSARTSDRCVLRLDFKQSERVCALRLFSRSFVFPDAFTIEGRSVGNGWRELVRSLPVPGFFWSGPRPWWRGIVYRAEYVFPVQTVDSLRVTVCPDDTDHVWNLSELQVFGPAAAPPAEKDSLDRLLAVLDEQGIDCLYADRWVANTVCRRSGGQIVTSREPSIFGDRDNLPTERMKILPGTGVLVKDADAVTCAEVFEKRGLVPVRVGIPPWTLFCFDHAGVDLMHLDPCLYWAGYSCLKTDDKEWTAHLMARAESVMNDSGDSGRALELLNRALEVSPDYVPVLNALAACEESCGRTNEAQRWRSRAGELATPSIALPVSFDNGVELTGIDISRTSLSPGESFRMRYYWRVPTDFDRKHPVSVFVHFGCGERFFQDDHDLLPDAETSFQPYPEVFVEESFVVVPDWCEDGVYPIIMGLFMPGENGERIPFTSDLPTGEKRAVLLPVSLAISRRGPVKR